MSFIEDIGKEVERGVESVGKEFDRFGRSVDTGLRRAGDAVTGAFDDVTGKTSADAARESAEIQAQAGQAGIERVEEGRERAQDFFSPFDAVGQRGLERLGELGPQDDFDFQDDPQADFEFLQNNPLFKFALDNANRRTGARAAAGGRINAGDTLSQLTNNAFLQASPLLDRKRRDLDRRLLDRNQNRDRSRQDIFGLLDRGIGVAGGRAGIEQGASANVSNLLTDIGASRAGGVVGAANARQGGIGNILDLAGTISSFIP